MADIKIKVVPGASRSRVIGWLGDALKVAVVAPPQGGRANEAVVELLSEMLGVGRGEVVITSSLTQARKVVRVSRLTEADLLGLIEARLK